MSLTFWESRTEDTNVKTRHVELKNWATQSQNAYLSRENERESIINPSVINRWSVYFETMVLLMTLQDFVISGVLEWDLIHGGLEKRKGREEEKQKEREGQENKIELKRADTTAKRI